MKRVGNLFEKICSYENLKNALNNAAKGKEHYTEVKMIRKDEDAYLLYIQYMLENDTYSINESDYKVEYITEHGKERKIMKLSFLHRIIQWAIMLQCERYLLKSFCYHSCSSVPEAGGKRAHNLIRKFLKRQKETQYCLQIDVRKFYDNIDHAVLKSKLRRKFKDEKLLNLLNKIIDSYPGDKGVPIGSYLSQYFANFTLTDFDWWLKQEKKIKFCCRYMDDLVVFHSDKQFLHSLRAEIQEKWADLNLEMKPNYQVFPVDKEKVDFVGFVYAHNNDIKLRRRAAQNLRKVSNQIQKYGMTAKRFRSINSIIGSFHYFQSTGLYDTYIKPILGDILEFYAGEVAKRTDDFKTWKNKISGYLKRIESKRKGFKSTKPKKSSACYKMLPAISLKMSDLEAMRLKCPQK